MSTQDVNASLPPTRPKNRRVALGIALVAVPVFAAALAVGPASLTDLTDPALAETILEGRVLRMLTGLLTGSALAVSGVMVQGIFRNPLASPSILGTTAGASLGGRAALIASQLLLPSAAGTAGTATLSVAFQWLSPAMMLPIGALLGALIALSILLVFARFRSEPLTLLLIGFTLSALFMSLGAFLTSAAQDSWQLGRAVLAFSLGSLSGTTVHQLLFALPLFVTGMLAAWCWGKPFDVLLTGAEEATTLGLDIRRVQWWGAVWVAVLTGTAVALSGSVAFVGLIVPHALRPFVGVQHRTLIPASALLGGVFVVACDTLGRALPIQNEVPLSVVTGLVGAPLFLWLLLRDQRLRGHHA